MLPLTLKMVSAHYCYMKTSIQQTKRTQTSFLTLHHLHELNACMAKLYGHISVALQPQTIARDSCNQRSH